MRKNYYLFQLAFIISLIFVQASNDFPNNNVPKTNPINNIEDVFVISNVQASEDTYVRAGSYANDNFGSSSELYIKSSTNNTFVREALMKFDLSAYETITSAKIYIYAYAQVSMDVNAYSIDNDSWSENSATWNNAPSFNTNIGTIALPTSYSWVELDISSAVINDFNASDKTFSIGFKDDNGIKKTIRISSKENSAQYIPYIQIEGILVGGGGDVAITGVSVSPTSTTININGTQQLSETISPSNATNQVVSWSSSNPSIASVNSSGLVTGVAAGSTTVTVTTDDGSFTSNSTITVNSVTEPARDVYLVIGQSNTAGRGAIEAEDMVALNGVDLFNGSTWESAVNTNDIHPTTGEGLGGLNRYSTIYNENQTQGLNFSYTFGHTLNEQTGNQIGLVVNARGGTNINAWAKGASEGYYAAAISQINLALAIPNTTIKGILWHQGESNRNDSNYLTKLSDLIADLRSDLGISDLPFIAGQLSMEREDNETFNTNLETLPSLVSNTDYAESDGLQTTDLTHFDSAAQRILGERYASKILQLVYDSNPSIACIEDISQTNDAGVDGAVVTYVAPEGTDNLPGATTAQTAGLVSGELFPIGTTTNVFVVTDSAGSTATCSFTVTIIDDENPSIACLTPISQTNDPGVDGAVVTYVTPVGTDNSTGETTLQTAGLASGELFPIGTTTNTFEVTDAAGNTAACSFDVTVTDNEDPTIICLADISQSADTGVNGAIVTYAAPVGTDNSMDANTLQTAGLASGELFPLGATTNTFVVSDAAGNTATCSFTVTIEEDGNPSIECLSNLNQTNDAGIDGAIVTFVTPVGTDNLPGASTVQTTGLTSGSIFPIGTTTNTFVVTDTDDNTATCSFTVTVTDDEDPAINCLEDISQTNNTGVDGAIVTYATPVGTDNSTGVNTVQTAGLASGSLFPVGTTTNTFVVTDAAGNTATCSFTVTVTDDEDPVIICLADISQTNDTGVDGAIVTYAAPVGADNSTGVNTLQTEGLASDSLFPIGTTINTFVVTDSSGNSATCSFTVTVTDNEDPSIVCLTPISQSADTGANGAIITYTTPVGVDNSTGATTLQTEGLASGSLFPIGTTTNTFVVTDAAGNTGTCSFTVTVTEVVNTCNILINENNFNSSWGIWNDGGADCRRNSNDASFANGGTGRCVRLRDNTSTSVMTTDALNLSTYEEITIEFNYIADQMESGEDFWLQISTDGGSSYQTVGDWDANDEFVNGTRYFENVTIQGPFPTNTYLRFRADASANADLIYIDDVKITGCSGSGAASKNTSIKKEVVVDEPLEVINKLFYSNPVENELIIKSDSIIDDLAIFSLNGVHIRSEKVNKSSGKLNVSSLQSGTYILVINNGNKKITKLFVKK